MMIVSGIKHLLRMPVKVIFFLLLLAACGILLSAGGNLWLMNRNIIRRYEENFSTIGTIEQKPSATVQEETWDAGKKDYELSTSITYGEILPLSLLDFEGAEYIYAPEKRGHYGAYAPEYELGRKVESSGFKDFVVEVTPLKDCIPDHPVDVKVEKVYYGTEVVEGRTIQICNHFERNPQPLYQGKTYIAYCTDIVFMNEAQELEIEYVTGPALNSYQYQPDGRAVESGFKAEAYYEVTEGFHETEVGRRWKEYIKTLEMREKTIPVTATESVNLLMPFYSGNSFVAEGRGILEEEYLSGDRVCLVPEEFADRNQLVPGDSLRLRLYYADYAEAAAEVYLPHGGIRYTRIFALDSRGEAYPVFEDSEYKIVGIYKNAPGGSEGDYAMGMEEVIIPSRSISSSAENNIVKNGPMKGNTTSFQIPNGHIEAFMKEWEKKGIGELEITFYDKGYSGLKDGLDNMKRMSAMLLAAGGVLTLFILMFFSHLFIAAQKLRTAIERSLGMTRRQCALSLTSGILAVLIAGSMAGSMAGGMVSGSLSSESFQDAALYDTSYTVGSAEAVGEAVEGEELDGTQDSLPASLAAGGMMLVMGGLIFMYRVRKNLQSEPLQLLGGQKE